MHAHQSLLLVIIAENPIMVVGDKPLAHCLTSNKQSSPLAPWALCRNMIKWGNLGLWWLSNTEGLALLLDECLATSQLQIYLAELSSTAWSTAVVPLTDAPGIQMWFHVIEFIIQHLFFTCEHSFTAMSVATNLSMPLHQLCVLET